MSISIWGDYVNGKGGVFGEVRAKGGSRMLGMIRAKGGYGKGWCRGISGESRVNGGDDRGPKV